jgi:hypothetical protein
LIDAIKRMLMKSFSFSATSGLATETVLSYVTKMTTSNHRRRGSGQIRIEGCETLINTYHQTDILKYW